MKKSILVLLILFLIISPLISAVEFDLKNEFKQGETLLAKVSGNFVIPITDSNVFFYRKHVRIPVDFDISKIDGDFYIYAVLPENPGNYSLKIENARYMQGSTELTDDLVKEFQITSKKADFSISPGFVYTSDDFEISMQNLLDEKLEVEIMTTTSSGPTGGFFSSLFGSVAESAQNKVSLKSGEIKKVDFKVDNVTSSTLKFITLKSSGISYEIPVYVFKNSSGIQINPKTEFDFNKEKLTAKMPTNTSTTYILYLTNNGEKTLNNITFSLSGNLLRYVKLSSTNVSSLKPDESYKLELFITSETDEQKIEGQLSAKDSQNTYTYSALFLEFLKDYTPIENGSVIDTNQNNSNNGEICIICDPKTEICNGTKNADGCCSKACTITNTKQSDSSTRKIIGWTLLIIVVLFFAWFFKFKYKRKKKPIDLVKIGSGKK